MPTKPSELETPHRSPGGRAPASSRRRKSGNATPGVSKSPSQVVRNASASVERRSFLRSGSGGVRGVPRLSSRSKSPSDVVRQYSRQGSARLASTTPGVRVYSRHASLSTRGVSRNASVLGQSLGAASFGQMEQSINSPGGGRRRVASRSAHHDRRSTTLDERLRQTGLQLYGTPRDVYTSHGRGYYSVPSPHLNSVANPALDEAQLQQKGRTLYSDPVPRIEAEAHRAADDKQDKDDAAVELGEREKKVLARIFEQPSPAAQRLAAANPPMYPPKPATHTASNGNGHAATERPRACPLPPPRVMRDDSASFVTTIR
eukprot:TRINITY_DN1359_c0_g1_i1.p1 TRINITY_DN1359_c0_g1~~TRINITY_DN1359_c0_g1_i1.p1  ORF type:complete len:331 (+),score=100.88 TRINITY_DN1359_c0_g1_i1:43-993(+)